MTEVGKNEVEQQRVKTKKAKLKKRIQVLSLLLLMQANKGLPAVQQQQRINLKKKKGDRFLFFPILWLMQRGW